MRWGRGGAGSCHFRYDARPHLFPLPRERNSWSYVQVGLFALRPIPSWLGGLMNPADEAEGVEEPEQAGGGQHHHGTKKAGQKPHLLLVRRQDLFTSGHGLDTSYWATDATMQCNPESWFVKKPG